MLGRGKTQTALNSRAFFYVPRLTAEGGLFAEDRKGRTYIFKDLLKTLAHWIDRDFPPLVYKYPDRATNEYLKNYGMVIVMVDHEGNKICYSTNYRNKLPAAFVDRVRSHLQIMPEDTILWAADLYNELVEVPASEVIYGERRDRQPKGPSRKALAAKWQHPDALTPDELSFLMGKSPKP